MKNINTKQLEVGIKEKTIVLLDVLPEESYKAKTIPSALNACVYKTSFVHDVATLVKKDTPLVVFGLNKSYGAAERAYHILTSAGYSNVSVYKEGIEGWEKAGKSTKGSKKSLMQSPKNKVYVVNTKESYVEWEGSNIFNKHIGTIGIQEGKFTVSKNTLSKGTIVIDMNSIKCLDLTDTAVNTMLINHLKSSDFFETQTYPKATLILKSITPTKEVDSNLNYTAKATFTLKGITKPLHVVFHGHYQGNTLVAQGSLVIDRTLWNVQYGSSKFFELLGQHLVHDQIRLRFKIVAR